MRIILALLLTITAASAQQVSPDVQAARTKLLQEISNNLQCMTDSIVLQQENAKLKKELEELKEKANAK